VDGARHGGWQLDWLGATGNWGVQTAPDCIKAVKLSNDALFASRRSPMPLSIAAIVPSRAPAPFLLAHVAKKDRHSDRYDNE
jgi:hypothetical protein